MGKQNCLLCQKELGMMTAKFGRRELLASGITIFDGFTDDSVLCKECFDDKKKEAKQSKEEAKEEMKQVLGEVQARVPEYKQKWDKNGIVQFKNERIAILKKAFGAQVEFIIAFDDLTKDGYRLMAIDEGKEGQAGGITGGISSYYYFQKMEFVR